MVFCVLKRVFIGFYANLTELVESQWLCSWCDEVALFQFFLLPTICRLECFSFFVNEGSVLVLLFIKVRWKKFLLCP